MKPSDKLDYAIKMLQEMKSDVCDSISLNREIDPKVVLVWLKTILEEIS